MRGIPAQGHFGGDGGPLAPERPRWSPQAGRSSEAIGWRAGGGGAGSAAEGDCLLLRAVDGAVRPRRGGRRLENVLLLPGRPERGTALPGCSLCQHGRSLSSWASRAWGWTAGAGAGRRLCPRRRSATKSRRCAGKWPKECRPCRWVHPRRRHGRPPAVGAGRGAGQWAPGGWGPGPRGAGTEAGWAGAPGARATGPARRPRRPRPRPGAEGARGRVPAGPRAGARGGPAGRGARNARSPGPGGAVTASPTPARACRGACRPHSRRAGDVGAQRTSSGHTAATLTKRCFKRCMAIFHRA